MKTHSNLISELIEVIDFYRGIVLDSVDQELGDTPTWPHLRSRLLKAFGTRGLEGRIREVIASEFGSDAGCSDD